MTCKSRRIYTVYGVPSLFTGLLQSKEARGRGQWTLLEKGWRIGDDPRVGGNATHPGHQVAPPQRRGAGSAWRVLDVETAAAAPE